MTQMADDHLGGPKYPGQPSETSDVTWAQMSNPVSSGQQRAKSL